MAPDRVGVPRYDHPVFALQYHISEGDRAHLDDFTWYSTRLREERGCVLELGAGTGRVTRELMHTGCRMVALDIARPMLDILRADEPTSVAVCADMTRLPIGRGASAVVCAYNGLGCLLERVDLTRTFEEAARVLPTRGIFLFDVAVPRPTDRRTTPLRLEWETWPGPDGLEIRRRITVIWPADAERMELTYEYQWRSRDGAESSRTVPFSLNTWGAEVYLDAARDAGFEVILTDAHRSAPKEAAHWMFVELRRG